jgi:TatD DNase family protein
VLTPGWIDNHCHLDDERISGGPGGAIARAAAMGVTGFITIGTNRDHSLAAIAIAEQFDNVWCTVGLHPHDASDTVESIADLVESSKVQAIGECGLDYHYDHSPRDVQRQAFAEQIAMAHRYDLALVIHTREAWDDTFAILTSEGVPERTIFHCFSGGPDEAERCIELGGYLSFSGVVTFKNAHDLRAAAALCPHDRTLVETDSPYLTPVPLRGRPNEPAHVSLVGAAVAEAQNRPVEHVQSDTYLNTIVAFKLTES